MRISNDFKIKYFSVLISTLPLLGVYKSIVPGIDLGSFLLIVFLIISFKWKIRVNIFTPLVLYIFIITTAALIVNEDFFVDKSIVILRLLKITITLIIVFLLGFDYRYYSEEISFESIKVLTFINVFFISLQRALFMFGLTLNNPLLRFSTSELYTSGYRMLSGTLFRPSGFFLEPSHFAVYGIVFLCYSLLKKDSIRDAVIIAFGIICTGSGIGIIGVLVVFCIYYILKLKMDLKKAILLSIAGSIAIVLLYRTTFIQKAISRFTTNNTSGGGNAIAARIGYGYQLFQEKSLIGKIFGVGYGNIPGDIYLNGTTYIINTLGIIGFILFIIIIINCFHKGYIWQKCGVFILLVLTFFSQIFAPASLAFYFCVYMAKPSNSCEKELLKE